MLDMRIIGMPVAVVGVMPVIFVAMIGVTMVAVPMVFVRVIVVAMMLRLVVLVAIWKGLMLGVLMINRFGMAMAILQNRLHSDDLGRCERHFHRRAAQAPDTARGNEPDQHAKADCGAI